MGSDEPLKRRRRRRYDIPGHARYLTFSCWQGRPFLARDRPRLWLLEALDAARRVHPFDLWAWCLMPEHVHLLILPAPGVGAGAILRSIKHPVARQAVSWVREKIGYIQANPVRRGLVKSPRDWPWSSCRVWEDGTDEPIRLDRASVPPLEP